MAREILKNERYHGKTVLICRDHKIIPPIAKALPRRGKMPRRNGRLFVRPRLGNSFLRRPKTPFPESLCNG